MELPAPDETLQEVLDRFWRRAEPRGALLQDAECTATELPGGARTHGDCGRTLVTWAYEGEDGKAGAIQVCAVGDCAYMFPRFL